MGFKRSLNMLRNIKNWDSYLSYKLRGRKEESFTFKLRNNFVVKVPRQVIYEFKESFFEEVYFKNLPKEIFNVNNPAVLDIGANVGFFSIYALLKFKTPGIIAFEPIKRNFELLQINLASIMNDKLTIVNKAVSKINGEIVLKFNKEQKITTSASIFDNPSGTDEETVLSTTLEEIFKEYKLSKIDLLKLDCEGAEYGIFYDTPPSFFDKVNCIALETHRGAGKNENHKALANYLRELGFNIKAKPDDLIWAYKNTHQWV